MHGHPYRTQPAPRPVQPVDHQPAPVALSSPLDWMVFAIIASMVWSFCR